MDYTKTLSKKAQNIQPSGIRKFFNLVSEMPEVISLGVGEPDFRTPVELRKVAIEAVKGGKTFYTPNNGLTETRKLIAEYYKKRFNISYDYEKEILVTVGASQAIDLAFRVLLDEGDEVIVPQPCFVCYNACVELAGGVAVNIPCYEKDNFSVTAETIEKAITPKTKALFISFPNNPTGAVMEVEELEKIAKLVIKHNLYVLSDEIYSELVYGFNQESIASLEGMKERTIVVSGFSKAFAMTGWRIGYFLAPKEITELAYKIHQQTIMCAPTISQMAANEGLREGLKNDFAMVKKMRDQYNERRVYLVDRLNKMGLRCFEPKGAFYVFPNVSSTKMNGDEFAMALLNSKSVAVVPGSAFGAGDDFIRISYAYSIDSIKIALDKIEEFVKEVTKK